MLEVLAPAGDMNSLIAAVQNGANSVYIGGRLFSARQSAVNFDNAQIADAIEYCHLRGVKLYCVINTLIKNTELKPVFSFIAFLYTAGIDAVIIQDLAVLNIIKSYFPTLPVYASTQMTVHNQKGAEAACHLGFDRVILSRELSFDNIKYIVKNTDIDVEIFAHGAICMSYSGQCLMSSVIGLRSGNRGRCAQPCRLPYSIVDTKTGKASPAGTYLSPKDMCLVNYLPKIKDAGVKSIKIEGRMKSAEYVAAVSAVYSKYASRNETVSAADQSLLSGVFSRGGFTDGYFTGKKGPDMMQKDNTGAKISMKNETQKALSAAAAGNQRKHPIQISACLADGQPLSVSLLCEGFSVTKTGALLPDKAKTKPITKEKLSEQLAKFGNTPFCVEDISISEFKDGLILPVSEINDVRRRAAEALEQQIINSFKRNDISKVFHVPHFIKRNDIPFGLSAQIYKAEQLPGIAKYNPRRVYIPFSEYLKLKPNEYDLNFVINPPAILHDHEMAKVKDIPPAIPVLASNLSHFEMFKGHRIHGGFRLNVFNSLSAYEYVKLGCESVCLSPELNLQSLGNIETEIETECIVYGRLPLMITENCAISSVCSCGKTEYALKDRTNASFPVLPDKSTHRSEILNSAPIYMADKMEDVKKIGINTGLLIFTVENSEKCDTIYSDYINSAKNNVPGHFTRGYFYRKVL